MKLQDILDDMDESSLLNTNDVELFDDYAEICNVYRLEGSGFLSRNYGDIAWTVTDEDTAKLICEKNVKKYLTFCKFKSYSQDVIDFINNSSHNFADNMDLYLEEATYKKDSDESVHHVKNLPNGCVAFRNGVFDFRNNKWLFKYDVIKNSKGKTRMYIYNMDYIIKFYVDIVFVPWQLNIMSFKDVRDFVTTMRDVDASVRNNCFELVYNMSFDEFNTFNYDRFLHLTEIMGYLCCNTVAENFVMIFGEGSNGKDSLFKGCFSSFVVPRPASLSLDKVLTGQFATGTLMSRSHNINLELSPKLYRDISRLKELTGGDEVDVEKKNVQSFTSVVDCKYLFAGNVQSDIRFSDTSNGLDRRVNIMNIFYTWDKEKTFLKLGDYYDTTFSLSDIKTDPTNVRMFIYLAMFGLRCATAGFKSDFAFDKNEWTKEYLDIDDDFVKSVNAVTTKSIVDYMKNDPASHVIDLYSGKHVRVFEEEFEPDLFPDMTDESYARLINNVTGKFKVSDISGFYNASYDVVIDDQGTVEKFSFAETALESLPSFYIKEDTLMRLMKWSYPQAMLTKKLKKTFGSSCVVRLINNRAFVRCKLDNAKLTVLK